MNISGVYKELNFVISSSITLINQIYTLYVMIYNY